MREIKFRAWDKKNKCWFKSELTFYGFALFGECTLICPPRVEHLQNIEVTQFIGMVDKNKKEIYEGDILQWNDDVDAHYEVFYHDDEARFKCSRVHYHGNRCGGMIPDITSPNLHVVGNVFEDHKLIK